MVKPDPHGSTGENRQERRSSPTQPPLDAWLLASATVWSVAVAVAGSVAVAVAGFVSRSVTMWFLVWFAGLLVLTELVPPRRLRPRTRRALQVVVVAGYLGFGIATYALVQPWITS